MIMIECLLKRIAFLRKTRKDQFATIYRENIWGGKKGTFFSGEGSHKKKYVDEYLQVIEKTITKNCISSIVDLGCGDFNIAKSYVHLVEKYVGVDIVDELIEYNTRHYGKTNIKFECLDIVEDELPDGELCLIRQVFQHLTNNEIRAVIKKLDKYRWVIITEDVYSKQNAIEYNKNIDFDRKTRRQKQSGVYLEEAPFNMEVEVLHKYTHKDNAEMVMYLLDNSGKL